MAGEVLERVEGVVWRYDSPAGDSVLVRFHAGRWEAASFDEPSVWFRDDGIPGWPGEFGRFEWLTPNHDVMADLRHARDESRAAFYDGSLSRAAIVRVMEPSKFDRARMDVQAAAGEYQSALKVLSRSEPPDPGRLLLALSEALVMVINELDDQAKGRWT